MEPFTPGTMQMDVDACMSICSCLGQVPAGNVWGFLVGRGGHLA